MILPKRYNQKILAANFRKAKSGKTSKGEKQFKQAIESLGLNQMQMIDLANAFDQIGYTTNAIEVYKKGRQLFKDQRLFTFELSSLYQKAEMYDEIVYRTENCIRRSSDD